MKGYMTTGLIIVLDEHGDTCASFYQNGDGGPHWLGESIKDFLRDKEVVSGIPPGFNTPEDGFNGMNHLASHLIAFLVKKNIGNIYMVDDDFDCKHTYHKL